MTKFSIVTPSYNQGEFIERTMQSVLSQEGVALEYVVFDGGSIDQTVDVLKRYGAEHSENLRWTSENDRGQTHAVNKGINSTSGDIIGWLNSDDIYYPGALRAVADYFTAHPEIDVLYGFADHIDANDCLIDPYPVESWNFQRMLETCIICQPAAFFRRRVAEAHGLLDERLHYCMDYEFWLRLGVAGIRFERLERKVAGSRMYAQNKTLRARRAVHAEINDMMKRKFGRVPERWLLNYAHIIAEESFERKANPSLFAFTYGFQSLLADWRWNGKISRETRSKIWNWCIARISHGDR